jgi:hypothetical protein
MEIGKLFSGVLADSALIGTGPTSEYKSTVQTLATSGTNVSYQWYKR